ncbi:MAG: hypothetical protein K9G41_12165 [Flavobacteriales bacterium]|nr:hypothetical protein [Flavobacteriales bacterium]
MIKSNLNRAYGNLEIKRPLYYFKKKVSSSTLKVGDRFIHAGCDDLMFKTDVKPVKGKYLCCDEKGNTEWIEGSETVIRINGIVSALVSFSKQFKHKLLETYPDLKA